MQGTVRYQRVAIAGTLVDVRRSTRRGCPSRRLTPTGHHATVGRRRRARFDRWTHRSLDLDGDLLMWLRIRRDGRPQILEAFRLESRGALHPPDGLALLNEHSHPDAAECVISELGAVPSHRTPSK